MEIKLKDGVTGYNAVIDILSMIIPQLYTKYFPGDLVVRIGCKYEESDEYYYDNYILEASEACEYCCFVDDWWEGEKYINIIGFVPVDDIRHFDFMLPKNEKGNIVAESYSEVIHPTYDIVAILEGPSYEII